MLEGQFNESMATQHPKNASNAQANNNNRRPGVSARKLAATLWELQEISLSGSTLPTSKVTNDSSDLHPPDTPSGKRNKQPLSFPPSPASAHITMRALRRSTIKCRFADGSRRKPVTAGQNAASTTHMQVLKLLERAKPIEAPEEEDTHEIEVDEKATTTMPAYHDDKPVPNSNGTSSTSSELLKVLNRVWSLEEQHKSSITVVNSLQSDLEGARSQVKDLTIQQISHKRDMESLIKQLSDERSEWQEKEKEKALKALQTIREELEEEKKAKRKLDLIHRKVTKEMIDVKKSLMKALQDLEREQKARELMEDVCDELAREVGEDKARVEELKRESVKVREEVEEERKMLQVAEVWREERVQMKLAEARLEIEEKNTALDKLRTELDAFLKAKRASGATQNLASAVKANPKPELGKTQVVGNEQQSSAALVSLLKEAYEVNDEHQITDHTSIDVEIKGTAQQSELPNSIPAVTDDDEEEEEDDDDDDLDFIELKKSSHVKGVEVMQSEKMKGVTRVDNLDSTSSVDKVHSSLVENVMSQGMRQGVRSTSVKQAEAMGVMGENEDKVKTWSFKLDMPWSSDTMVAEKIDKKVSSEDINNASTYEPKSNMRGERYFSFTQDEREGNIYEPQLDIKGERYFSLAQEKQGCKATIQTLERGTRDFSESISSIEGNIKLCEPPSNTEAVGIGVWSLQNLGNSTRDVKGTSGFSSGISQQSESPTERWEHNMPSPGVERSQDALSSRPSKAAMVGSSKPSKDNTVKGKLAETKPESRQRFRFGRA